MQNILTGAGLGLRRELLSAMRDTPHLPVDFLEIAPENWIQVGGRRGAYLNYFSERFPLVCHGLSLSLGGITPLDETLLMQLKHFFKQYKVVLFSEHLSFCNDEQGMLYDLLPLPFSEAAVKHVAERIRYIQDKLEQRIAIENISYYCPLATELTESEFINAVLETADCDLLLDVNNVYVNSINHHYDAVKFLQTLPQQRIAYIHLAGHFQQEPDLLIDTHGSEVIAPVWKLLEKTYQLFGAKPTLLERDNDIPPLADLLQEIEKIKQLQDNAHVR